MAASPGGKWKDSSSYKSKDAAASALKLVDGTWACNNKGKASALATTLANEYKLAELRPSDYSRVDEEQLIWLID